MKPRLWLVGGVVAIAVLGGCAGMRPGAQQEAQQALGAPITPPFRSPWCRRRHRSSHG